jgi:cytochrome c oxidase assembly protein subunit 15
VLIVLLNTMGGVVCVTESGLGCPDWPGCYGRAFPPLRTDAIIEYSHRLVAALTSGLLLTCAILGWRKHRSIPWVGWPPVAAIPFLVAVSIFGMLAVLRGLEPGLAALDLGSALIVQTLMLAATAVALYLHHHPTHPGRLSFRAPFAGLSLATLLAVFAVLVSGPLVARDGTLEGCLGWPQGSDGLPPLGLYSWPQLARWVLAIVAGILIVATVAQAWRTRRSHRALLFTATAVGALWIAESVLGALLTLGGRDVWLLVLHVATAVSLWALLVVLVVLAGLEDAAEARNHLRRKG